MSAVTRRFLRVAKPAQRGGGGIALIARAPLRRVAGPTGAAAEQQLGEPGSGSHQVTAGVLPGSDAIHDRQAGILSHLREASGRMKWQEESARYSPRPRAGELAELRLRRLGPFRNHPGRLEAPCPALMQKPTRKATTMSRPT